MKRSMKILGVVLALALITAACGGDGGDGGGEGDTSELTRGGTLKIAMVSDVSAAFDPQKEYYSVTWQIFRCCLLRTLVSYPGEATEDGGNDLVPDLAEDLPEQSEDELTWTFTLKQGLHYGPPFEDEEITSQGFINALEREADPEASANGYSFYYSVIEGFDEFSEGKADSISGLNAPDDYTLEVTTSRPTGDLPFRMAMPAAAPIPDGAADNHVRDYGRFLVSTGPYMFEGAEDLDHSKKDAKPVAGYDPGKSITLVRNPTWVAEEDSDDIRPAYPDRMEFTIGGTEEDIANKIDAGDIHINIDGVPPAQQLRRYQNDPELKDQIQSYASDAVRYISFNLAEPPFDDVAVRKALNFALDKEGMRRVRGGPLFGDIANHIIVDGLLDNQLVDYNPYPSEGDTGDIDAAKEAMSESKYDTDGDGVCDADVCKDILAAQDEADPYPDQTALIQDNFEPLGITLDVKSLERTTMYDKCLDPAAHTAICLGPAWAKDYSDATTFAGPLFGDESLGPDACCNYSLVGASSDLLNEFEYEVTDVPAVDDKIDECDALPFGDERIGCYVELDQMLMEDVVPWIPYLFDNNVDIVSADVLNYRFDQFSSGVDLSKLAIANAGDA